MQEMVEATLAARGYENYETSAFAKPGRRCTHNLNYWTFGDYLGIGAGAHGKISSPTGIIRETRRRHPREYLESAAHNEFAQEQREIGRDALPFEFMMNALRLTDGFTPALFETHTGMLLATQRSALLEAQRRGLLEVGTERIAPTVRGRRFLNDLLEIFLEQPSP